MKTKVSLIIVVLFSSLSFAQTKVADKFFKNYAYIKASELYEVAVKKGDSSEHVLTRLGDCYYNNSKSAKAAMWYKKALHKYPKIQPEYLYKYIQVQRSLGNYEEADVWLKKFKDFQSNDSRSKFVLGDISVYKKLSSMDQVNIKINNLDLNTQYSDFGGYQHNGKLFFASARNTGKKVYDWNEEPFLDLFQADVSSSDASALGNVEPIKANKINTDYHEASVAITKDGKTLYFTRDNLNKRNRINYDKEGTSHLKIYKASLNNETWTNLEELPFNDKIYSTGHPALSPDEKTLYFVSDRDGGYGQTDIYKVDILEDGSYGKVQNLGTKINTEGREMFPYIAKDSTMYFSSDGYINLGLLDIYKTDLFKNEEAKPENLGAPFNTGADDFAFFIDSDDQSGYFSSNRDGGKGNDDIYSFNTLQCKQTLSGIARDASTKQPLIEVTVKIINAEGVIMKEIITNEVGEYTCEVDCNKEYTILGSKPDYKNDLKALTPNNEHNYHHKVDLELIPLIKDNQIVINPIFFDFDKWNIRTDAQYELEHIVTVMNGHPNMIIKIESHTDSRGNDRYNMKLSDRRAKSTRDYLISRNIAAERIESAIGYGESQLLNACSNGVKCSKAQHQKNRRSYFYILKDD